MATSLRKGKLNSNLKRPCVASCLCRRVGDRYIGERERGNSYKSCKKIQRSGEEKKEVVGKEFIRIHTKSNLTWSHEKC